MTTEIEEMLARELHEVAGGVQVPPMPAVVPADEPSPRAVRPWQPLLVAAVVVLLVGVTVLVLGQGGSDEPEPAPSPTPTVSTAPTQPQDVGIFAVAPTVPYILDRRLYVDGTQVPGEWWGLETRNGVWLATQFDGSWWWGGPGIDGAMPIEAQLDQPPVLSSNGSFVGLIDLSSGEAQLTGFDTQPAGEGFGVAPIDDLPSSEDGVALRVAAVTDEGDVIVQGTRTSLMWRAQYADQRTVVDLTQSAPDQVILQGTPAGLLVVNGEGGATDATTKRPYLARISADGVLNPGDVLPTYDSLDISPGGIWLVRSPAGTLGGDVTSVATLSAQEVFSIDEVILDLRQASASPSPAGCGRTTRPWSRPWCPVGAPRAPAPGWSAAASSSASAGPVSYTHLTLPTNREV